MPFSWHVTREQQRTVSRDAQCVQTRDLEGHVSPGQRDTVKHHRSSHHRMQPLIGQGYSTYRYLQLRIREARLPSTSIRSPLSCGLTHQIEEEELKTLEQCAYSH